MSTNRDACPGTIVDDDRQFPCPGLHPVPPIIPKSAPKIPQILQFSHGNASCLDPKHHHYTSNHHNLLVYRSYYPCPFTYRTSHTSATCVDLPQNKIRQHKLYNGQWIVCWVLTCVISIDPPEQKEQQLQQVCPGPPPPPCDQISNVTVALRHRVHPITAFTICLFTTSTLSSTHGHLNPRSL